jgi:hypothetical protein
VLLGRTVGRRQHKVLGVKLPGQGANLSTVARGLKDAGTQFGKLANEVREARKTAAQVGKALS